MKKMGIKFFYLVLAVSIFQLLVLPATAESQVFNPTDDTYITLRSGATSRNFGADTIMEVENLYGASGSWGENSLVKFDISSVPTGMYVASATLYLYYNARFGSSPTGRSLNIYPITSSDWNEETVTWDNQPTCASQPTTHAVVPNTFGWISWDVTNDVKSFANGQTSNYGWKITDDAKWGQATIPVTSFLTKESDSNIPYLKIEYSSSPTAGGTTDTGASTDTGTWMGIITIIIIIVLCALIGIYIFKRRDLKNKKTETPEIGKDYTQTYEQKIQAESRTYTDRWGIKGKLQRNYKFLILWAIFMVIFVYICLVQTYGYFAMLVYFFGFLVFYAGTKTRYERRNLGPVYITDDRGSARVETDWWGGGGDILRTRNRAVTRVRNEYVDNSGVIAGLLVGGVVMIFVPIYLLTNGFTNIVILVLMIIDTITGIMAIILTIRRLRVVKNRFSRWGNKQHGKLSDKYERFKRW